MRVMIDTNILISALVFPSRTMDAVIAKVTTEHRLVLSSYVIDEFLDVIQRKFPGKADAARHFLNQLHHEQVHTPDQIQNGLFPIRDEDDYPVLYSAVTEDVDIFVTGDRDFENLGLERPEILTPAQFLEKPLTRG